ncbi:MAG: hypothetical protein M3Y82_11510 [Verrucomicrobiota bacterium]|nr:hypothetical protein [Verrucomicrobiota bacterium]
MLTNPSGSIGHRPAPSGDSPFGIEKEHELFQASLSSNNVLSIPSGQWPNGTGGSPVLPIRVYLCSFVVNPVQ